MAAARPWRRRAFRPSWARNEPTNCSYSFHIHSMFFLTHWIELKTTGPWSSLVLLTAQHDNSRKKMISDPKLRWRIWLEKGLDGLVVILGGGMCEELNRDWARMMNLTRTESSVWGNRMAGRWAIGYVRAVYLQNFTAQHWPPHADSSHAGSSSNRRVDGLKIYRLPSAASSCVAKLSAALFSVAKSESVVIQWKLQNLSLYLSKFHYQTLK